MRIVVYGAVLVITLGSVLLGLDWLSAPMSPMVNTEVGLRAAAPPQVSAPPAPKVAPAPPQPSATPSANIGVPIVPPSLVAPPSPNMPAAAPAPPQPSATPSANIGVPIVPPSLVAPPSPNMPAAASGDSVPAAPPATTTAREPEVKCNVDACTAAYRTFTASDCTYQPVGGPRKLCTK